MKRVLKCAVVCLLSVVVWSPASAQTTSQAQLLYQILDLDKFVDEAIVSAQKVLAAKTAAIPKSDRVLTANSADAAAAAKTEFRIRMLGSINAHFTAKELNDVNTFFGSDAGKSFRKYSPEFGHVLAVELMRASLSVAKSKLPPR